MELDSSMIKRLLYVVRTLILHVLWDVGVVDEGRVLDADLDVHHVVVVVPRDAHAPLVVVGHDLVLAVVSAHNVITAS